MHLGAGGPYGPAEQSHPRDRPRRDRLEARGAPITLQAVRAAIGGGSLASIQPLVKAWRAERQADRLAGLPAEEVALEAGPVPVRVAQALEAARAALDPIAAAAGWSLEAEREAAGHRLTEALERAAQAEAETEQVARDGAELEAERDRLAEAAAAHQHRIAELEEELAARRAESERSQAERDRLAEAAAAHQRRVAELEAELTARQAESERSQADRAAAARELAAVRERVEELHAALAEARAAQARAEARHDAAQAQAGPVAAAMLRTDIRALSPAQAQTPARMRKLHCLAPSSAQDSGVLPFSAPGGMRRRPAAPAGLQPGARQQVLVRLYRYAAPRCYSRPAVSAARPATAGREDCISPFL